MTVAAAASKGADSIQLELPKDMVSDIVRDTQAEVTVDSEQGALTLDRETLAQIAKEAKGSALTLTIHKAKSATEAQQKLTGAATQVYRLTLASANQNISQFDGKITVKLPIPATLLGKTVAAVHFDSAEKFTQMQGKRESRNKTGLLCDSQRPISVNSDWSMPRRQELQKKMRKSRRRTS